MTDDIWIMAVIVGVASFLAGRMSMVPLAVRARAIIERYLDTEYEGKKDERLIYDSREFLEKTR